jgi:hypothetical protein
LETEEDCIMRIFTTFTLQQMSNQGGRDGQDRNPYKIFIGTPERKRPVPRLRCIWESNIRMDLKETPWEVVEWIHLAQDRDQ